MKWLLPFAILLAACIGKQPTNQMIDIQQSEKADSLVDLGQIALDSTIERRMNALGLVNIKSIDTRILVDLKYASTDNFMKHQLYDTLRQLFLQRDVAIRLSLVQDALDSIKPGYRLLVFDGVRPVQVQREMWKALDSIPPVSRGKFVSNPALGSVHNFGAAVDLTIVDARGKPLDMGAGSDDFRKIAFPRLEAHFLRTCELSKAQWENRQLLRKVMRTQKFSNIPSEWWHFNGFSRINAARKYQLLETESGAARWMKIIPIPLNEGDSLLIQAS